MKNGNNGRYFYLCCDSEGVTEKPVGHDHGIMVYDSVRNIAFTVAPEEFDIARPEIVDSVSGVRL